MQLKWVLRWVSLATLCWTKKLNVKPNCVWHSSRPCKTLRILLEWVLSQQQQQRLFSQELWKKLPGYCQALESLKKNTNNKNVIQKTCIKKKWLFRKPLTEWCRPNSD
jgi:hypothetical protein